VNSFDKRHKLFPKGFKTIRALCIILGIWKLINFFYVFSLQNTDFIDSITNNYFTLWIKIYMLISSLVILFSALLILKFKNYGRIIILICSFVELIRIIVRQVTLEKIDPLVTLLPILIIITYAKIIEYFFNPNIKIFLFEYGNKKTYIEKTFDVKIKKHWINLRYLWYILFVSLIYSLMVKSFIHEKDTITSFLIGNLLFIIYSILIALIVKWSRYFIFKKKENFTKILFYSSLVICILFTYYLFKSYLLFMGC